MDENKVKALFAWPKGAKTRWIRGAYGIRQIWNERPMIWRKGCCLTSYSRCWAAKTQIRYRENHIGLGTKRFVDTLGSC